MRDRENLAKGTLLQSYLICSRLVTPLAPLHVARRLRNGKEDPFRYKERLGTPSVKRPPGPIIWMHGVGVGEILVLPGLAASFHRVVPNCHFVLTSTALTASQAVAHSMPKSAYHQFLPMDCPRFIDAFLDYWKPSLSIWSETGICPNFIVRSHHRGIPLAFVNGRMNESSFRSRRKAKRFFSDLYGRFDLLEVQDQDSARRFIEIGAPRRKVVIAGSLKSASPPLPDQPERRRMISSALGSRRIWLAASTHTDDEEVVLDAHSTVLRKDSAACLIVVPRIPSRISEIKDQLSKRRLSFETIRASHPPSNQAQVLLVDQMGQLGLWYRLSPCAFIGGSFGETGGHNPFEPARLGCAVLHGPNTANFRQDYEAFHTEQAALLVKNAEELASAVLNPSVRKSARNARVVFNQGQDILKGTTDRLVNLL